jgi:hypothetical protein
VVFSLGDWHRLYLNKLERLFQESSSLREKYKIKNSNRGRLYLPDWEGIKRKEILSNPDILLVNKEGDPAYIFEVEYQVNYKKIVGIAIMTDMAIRQMNAEGRPKLILITKEEFPNRELMEREIQGYVKKIDISLCSSDDFTSAFDSLIR